MCSLPPAVIHMLRLFDLLFSEEVWGWAAAAFAA